MRYLLACFITLFSLGVNAQYNSWYKTFTGNIDKYAVTLHLHKSAHSYSGYYYYNVSPKPIAFIGNDTAVKDKIQLKVYETDKEETFEFIIANQKLSGTWKNGEKKTLAIDANEQVQAVTFNYIFTQGLIYLKPNIANSPLAEYSAATVWPASADILSKTIAASISKLFGVGYSPSIKADKFLLHQKSSYFSNYLSDNKNVTADELKEFGQSYNNAYIKTVQVIYSDKKLLSLAAQTYTYTGGAHGSAVSSYLNFDIQRKKQLRYSDIFRSGTDDAVQKSIEKYFRIQHKLKPNQSLQDAGLFENTIPPTKNLYLTTAGVVFCYQQYEIGPYAMGQIEIFVPIHELKPLLQKGVFN